MARSAAIRSCAVTYMSFASLVLLGMKQAGQIADFNLSFFLHILLVTFGIPAFGMFCYAASEGVGFCAYYLVFILQAFWVCRTAFTLDHEDFLIWSPFAISVGIIIGAASKRRFDKWCDRFFPSTQGDRLPTHNAELDRDLPTAPRPAHFR